MIDYNEMEKVIQNLNEYVNKLQTQAETQQKLNVAIEEIKQIKNCIIDIEKAINEYTENINNLENTHNDIKNQFDNVLQDYKKLHSSFELLETKLKNIDTQNSIMENQLNDIKKSLALIKQQIKELDKNDRKINLMAYGNFILIILLLVISLVSFFI